MTFTNGQPLGFFFEFLASIHTYTSYACVDSCCMARRSFATMPFLATVIADEKVAAAYHNKQFQCTITISKEKSLI